MTGVESMRMAVHLWFCKQSISCIRKNVIIHREGKKMSTVIELQPLEVPVQKVTTYLDRAEIVRTRAQWQLGAGSYAISVGGLSGNIDEKTVRVSITGGKNRIGNVSVHKSESTAKEYQSRLKKLKKYDRTLRDKEAETAADIARLKKGRDVWNKYIDDFMKCNPANFTASPPLQEVASHLTTFLQTYIEESKKVDNALRDTEKAIQQTQQELAENTKELDTMRHEYGQQTRLALEAELQEEGQYTLSVSYAVQNAYWEPSYEIFITGEQPSRMKVIYKGTIQQTTGEDWHDVQLSLATVPPETPQQRPVRSNVPPPKPSRMPPVPAADDSTLQRRDIAVSVKKTLRRPSLTASQGSTFYALPGGQEDRINSIGVVLEGESQELLVPVYEHKSSGIETCTVPVLLEIPHRTTVPCDHSEVVIECASTSIEVLLTHTCTANLSPHVYVKVTGINSGEHIASGSACIFLDGNYMGTMDIPTIGRMDNFELQLGRDPDVRALIKAPQKTKNTTLTNGSTETVKHAFEVSNHHGYQIAVTAVWDITRNNGQVTSVSFVDAPATAIVPASDSSVVTRQGKLNAAGQEVEWWILIPRRKSHWTTLLLNVERPAVGCTAGQTLPEVSHTTPPAAVQTPHVERRASIKPKVKTNWFTAKQHREKNNDKDNADPSAQHESDTSSH